MHGIMLRCCDGQVVFWIVTLQSSDIGNAHAAGEKRIFAVSFLSAAPARVTEDIQIRGPEIQAAHDARMSFAHILHVLDAPLDANLVRHDMNSSSIEGRCQSNRLGILGYTLVDHSVERLTPPLICRNVEPRNRRGIVLHLRGFLRKSHPVYQVGSPLFRRQIRVQIGSGCCILGDQRLYCHGEEKRSSCEKKSLHDAFIHIEPHIET